MNDIRRILRSAGIRFVEYGEETNVKRGNINIHCPWCGSADKSHHLGIDIQDFKWGCWRNSSHRGRRFERVLCKILGISWAKASEMLGVKSTPIGFAHMRERLQAMDGRVRIPATIQPMERVRFPMEFRPIISDGITARFFRYVESRGFSTDEAEEVIERYHLQAAPIGDWVNRLIFPFEFEGKLVGWTGRAIGECDLRYMTYPSSSTVKEILYNWDACQAGGRELFVVEGPVDCIKTDFFAREIDGNAVGLLGLAYTSKQVELLALLADRYETVTLMLDSDALAQVEKLRALLRFCNPRVLRIADHIGDPGAMTRQQFLTMQRA